MFLLFDKGQTRISIDRVRFLLLQVIVWKLYMRAQKIPLSDVTGYWISCRWLRLWYCLIQWCYVLFVCDREYEILKYNWNGNERNEAFHIFFVIYNFHKFLIYKAVSFIQFFVDEGLLLTKILVWVYQVNLFWCDKPESLSCILVNLLNYISKQYSELDIWLPIFLWKFS